MLKENDFKWLTRRANNIPTNPVDCYYCIVDTGDGTGKMYVVKPLHAQNTDGMVKEKQGYKYFVFLDCSVQRVPTDQRNFPYSMSLYSGYRMVSETLVSVFDTIEDAKKTELPLIICGSLYSYAEIRAELDDLIHKK